MKDTFDNKIKSSKSCEIQTTINNTISGNSIHSHGHILYDIRDLLGKEKKIFFEIGSYIGHTTCLLLSHEYETQVYCVDPLNVNDGQEATLRSNLDKFATEKNTYTIFKNFSSDKILMDNIKENNIKIDILYIDGDHSSDSVINDFKNFEPLVNDGGFIIFDDYRDHRYCPGVKIAVDNIVDNLIDPSKYEIIGSLPDYQNAPVSYSIGGLNNFILYKKPKKCKDTLILVEAYFNYNDIDRTLESLVGNKSLYQTYDETPYDIIVLQNPSKYTDSMEKVLNKYSEFILKRYMSNENIEGNIFQYFLTNYRHITDKYRFIAITEGDVVLDRDAFSEAYTLINKYENVGNVSIDLSLENLKIPPLPPGASNWVPTGITCDDHIIGDTGFQFILFRKNHIYEFLEMINKKLICNSIACGVSNYYGISDTNLGVFNRMKGRPWIRTKYNKLLHIGWEHYMDPLDEYWQTKNESLKQGMLRTNMDLSTIKLTEF